jgi:hypothetical protein
MSLETGNFIKNLIDTNPEGTDPKSQGDDHLRLIKHVLKTQFSGLTVGIPIVGTEDDFNAITGIAGGRPLGNIDAGSQQFRIAGVVAGSTGQLPPGWTPGDVVVTIPWDGNRQYQLYFCNAGQRMLWRMYSVPTWGPWNTAKGIGVGQLWQNVAAQRAFTTQYINDSNQTIQVSVTAVAATANQTYMVGFVRGSIIARALISEAGTGVFGNIQLIVPPGHEYQINLTGGASATVTEWMELRQ